jgi:hypothetical protein
VIVCKVHALVLDLYDVRSITPRYICMRECVYIYETPSTDMGRPEFKSMGQLLFDNLEKTRREGHTSFRL